jgi:CHASE2 domain-containing sensor protein
MSSASRNSRLPLSIAGALLVALVGVGLCLAPVGEPWVNASYDYLFRFGCRDVTNQVSLILMDNAAFDALGQTRSQPWDRALHARLLNRLADDGCALVVLDSFLREPRDLLKDDALAAALRRQKRVVLMAQQAQLAHPTLAGAFPVLPAAKFLEASGTNWGVAWLNPDLDSIVRKQWPFPSPGPYPSLPWTAAESAGARLDATPKERYLRYYGPHGPWPRMSYQVALAQPANSFKGRLVFIGNWPATTAPDREEDKFSTPFTRWTGQTSGGVEILVSAFLNLLNGESLLRPPPWSELVLFAAVGLGLGAGLCGVRFRTALAVAVLSAAAVSAAAVSISYFTNYWFPWLIVAGAQIPCALGWSAFMSLRRRSDANRAVAAPAEPRTPGYELIQPPLGEGAYGKVWLARNKAGQWRALKIIYAAKFAGNAAPFDREFSGIKRYQPISGQHPALLRVDLVSAKHPECFYYAMELADSMQAGWQANPSLYQPWDLQNERMQSPKRRLPIRRCLEIGVTLCEALEFLHERGMTHRDIKPQNIVFVNGQPKLADLGLITEIRPDSENDERTNVGTPGYLPPAPEKPGTVAADLYALGMVLYVAGTGRTAAQFPEMATTLIDSEEPRNYFLLNKIILKACEPLPQNRYPTARNMGEALQAALSQLADE